MSSRYSGSYVLGQIRPYTAIFSELFKLGDLFLIFASFYAAAEIQDVEWSVYFTSAYLAAVLFFLAYSQLFDIYGSWRISGLRQEMEHVLLVWLITFSSLLFLAYGLKISEMYSRRVMMMWLLLAPISLCGLRVIVRHLLASLRVAGKNSRTAAVIGNSYLGGKICRTLEQSPWLGIKLDGLYCDDGGAGKGEETPAAGGYPMSGSITTLMNKAKNNEIDIVFIAMQTDKHALVEQVVAGFADTTVDVFLVPTLFTTDLLNSRWGYLGELPYLSLNESPFNGMSGTLKRLEDVILSLFILAIIAIPIFLIAIGIKLTSNGPVLFKQRRYGLDNREVMVWKFRTMTVMEDGDQIAQATRNDARITKFGAFLRKTSLDELPQFINVLQGHMSIVGPRPHAVAHNELYRKEIYGYTMRHKVKPGITGWAQVNGWRGETDTFVKMKKRVDHDLWYISNWSILLDLKIIILTVFKGFTDKQAY